MARMPAMAMDGGWIIHISLIRLFRFRSFPLFFFLNVFLQYMIIKYFSIGMDRYIEEERQTCMHSSRALFVSVSASFGALK